MTWPLITAEEFERAYAERGGVTVEWLRAQGRIVAPCDCREEGCEGWQSISQDLYEDLFATVPWKVTRQTEVR